MSETTKWHNKLDFIFSRYILEWTKFYYGKCPFCGGPIECCFHFIPRGKFGTRWNTLNAIGSCFKCNSDFESIADKENSKYIRWFYRTIGKNLWDRLVLKSNTLLKYSKSDFEAIYNDYSIKLKELGTMALKSNKNAS